MLDVEMFGIDFLVFGNMEELSALMHNNIEQLNVIFGEEQLGRLFSTEIMGLKLLS